MKTVAAFATACVLVLAGCWAEGWFGAAALLGGLFALLAGIANMND